MKYQYIVASDLDGTLLDKGEKLSAENAAAIEEMGKRGICFVPCSGRTVAEMPKCLVENPHIRYYIGADGSVIWDKQKGQLTQLNMSRDEATEVFDMLSDYDVSYTVRSGGESYYDAKGATDEDFAAHNMSKVWIEYVRYYSKPVENFDEFIRSLDGVGMVNPFFSSLEELEACRQRILKTDNLKVATTAPANLEIFHVTAGKGCGLLKLAEMLGVPKENTVAVGDSINDLDMLQKAGISLAMENASEEVKRVAMRTICHYKEHSAKYILENIIPR